MAGERDTIPQEDKIGYEIKEGEELEIILDEIVKEGKTDSIVAESEKEISDSTKEYEIDDFELEEEDAAKVNSKGKFKGHWASFDFGLNNYLDKNYSFSLTSESEFMELNTAKSWNFNLNFAQYSFPIYKNRVGLVTGMGIEWSNYRFSKNITIKKGDSDFIEPDTLNFSPIKSVLRMTYFTVPLLIEQQLFKGARNDRLYIATGVIGGVKLFSNAKVKFTSDGKKEKDKVKNDFYLSPFRYAVTARIGYKSAKFYCNYYLSPLFIKDKGLELYPIALGASLTF